ncbi:hypothetical protein [Wenzhouxiangella sp. EGI_FJ10409]|uniref:hypothetical protein n=1 Tax=Wenzhouxiangella sp. EGI_FJ10409 TaxID=3243767 RepID=UPI0035E2F093
MLERRYEKQKLEADEYAKDFIACFNLIRRLMEIESQCDETDEGQKIVAVGSQEYLAGSMRFIETSSELRHRSLLCEDAELLFPTCRMNFGRLRQLKGGAASSTA